MKIAGKSSGQEKKSVLEGIISVIILVIHIMDTSVEVPG